MHFLFNNNKIIIINTVFNALKTRSIALVFRKVFLLDVYESMPRPAKCWASVEWFTLTLSVCYKVLSGCSPLPRPPPIRRWQWRVQQVFGWQKIYRWQTWLPSELRQVCCRFSFYCQHGESTALAGQQGWEEWRAESRQDKCLQASQWARKNKREEREKEIKGEKEGEKYE